MAYTFEDALTLTNIELFKETDGAIGMLKTMITAANEATFKGACAKMYEALKGVKAQMALDVLLNIDPNQLDVPEYIAEGLHWLELKFSREETILAEVPPQTIQEDSV